MALIDKEQHERTFQELVVEYPSYNARSEHKGKPYFSIKYTEDGQEFIGYGTYKPEVLSEYLKEYFMPSAQSERLMTLSDDEIETIRIHLSAIKEELCNQSRYGEATYYEKLIAKFLSSNVIHCKNCKNYTAECGDERYALGYCPFLQSHLVMSEGFCAWAERRGEQNEMPL